MTGYVELLIIAFGAQLAVLPGEKVQFIIAGLSTRFHPLMVVAAAGSAFAGWTAVEILFGEAVRGALPEVYLSLLTAVLFLFFGYLLYRSAPEPGGTQAETDGSGAVDVARTDVDVLGVPIPDSVATFFAIFSMMAVGEFGDKTQLVTIGLVLEHGASSAIWAGEMLAIVPVSLANAFFFHRFAHRFDLRKAHFAAAGIFLFFGLDTLLSVAFDVSVWETVVTALADVVAPLVS